MIFIIIAIMLIGIILAGSTGVSSGRPCAYDPKSEDRVGDFLCIISFPLLIVFGIFCEIMEWI